MADAKYAIEENRRTSMAEAKYAIWTEEDVEEGGLRKTCEQY